MDFIKTPIFTFALVKAKIKSNLKLDATNLLILSVILTLASLTILYPLIILLTLYKQVTNLTLYLKYGDKYRGLLSGIDSICAREKNSIINMMAFFEYNGKPEELVQDFITTLQHLNDTKRQEKLFFVKNTFFGLNYYLRHDFKMSDLVRPLKTSSIDKLDKNTITEILRKQHQLPLPCNNTGLFEIVVCQQVLNFEPFTNKPTYMVLFRMHHSLGDGISICNALCGDFVGKDLPKEKLTLMDAIKWKLLELKLATMSTDVKSDITQIPDVNVLRTLDLSEDKHFVWFSEYEQDVILKIKKIRKFYNTSYLSVVTACLATTLYEYYQKFHKACVPEKVTSGVVYLPKPRSIEYGKNNIPLRNIFTAGFLQVPIKLNEKLHKNPLVSRLQMIQKEHSGVLKSIDIQLSYWVTDYLCSMLPEVATAYLIQNFLNVTFAVSSLPGGHGITYFGGKGIAKEFVSFSPNSTGTGIHSVVSSYSGNFKMSLTVDKAIIPEKQDAERLLSRTIELINELAETC